MVCVLNARMEINEIDGIFTNDFTFLLKYSVFMRTKSQINQVGNHSLLLLCYDVPTTDTYKFSLYMLLPTIHWKGWTLHYSNVIFYFNCARRVC